ncbi:MAG: efflux RND transporter permease subunit [Burkholderiales bacterium]|nr:efflux RND transporter permease subunit [Burkholderiales bacterium]
MKSFNLSEWALRHQSFVLYCIVVLGFIGVFSYAKLGQSEDPPFTFKIMTVRTGWPGATAREVEQQVTERVEKKLQEMPEINFVRSFSRPGESLVFVAIKDSEPAARIPEIFYQVRKKVGDIRHTLPAGINGPTFNDEFGDTFGNIYAITGDGYTFAELRDVADRIRKELLRVPDVAKVEIIGEQDEKIFIELANTKIATLGLDAAAIAAALAAQNAVVPAGNFNTAAERIHLRVTGDVDSVDAVRAIPVRAGGRTIRLGDIATVTRGYVDPPQPKVRYMGREALGLGVSMRKGGDIVALGANLDRALLRIEATLPVGLDIDRINDQPRAVRASIAEFVRSVAEAVLIVLGVSFLSLGLRTGVVVALSIPLVLALTFLFMHLFDVGLHKISLGALILALGLLVDDAIIAVEMMAVKIEEGLDRFQAAAFAYKSTAFPMLTGTLVTAAGFLPIATAQSATGEYTISIFQVVVISLLISWVAAVVVVPYLGYHLLPVHATHSASPGGWTARVPGARALARARQGFAGQFRNLVEWCVTWRKTVILVTVIAFVASVAGFRYVQQQFFPSSTRLELLVDLKLAEGASVFATEAAVTTLERMLDAEKNLYVNYASYVGSGSPRFYLPLDQQLPAASFAQIVVTTRDLVARERLREKLIAFLDAPQFSGLRGRVVRLENGPPVGYPVQFRVSGDDLAQLRELAGEVAAVMRTDPALRNVNLDWSERSKTIRFEIDQDRARALGITSQDLAAFLANSVNGVVVTTLRDRDRLVDVVMRGSPDERAQLSQLANLTVPLRGGRSVPITQVARISWEFEEGIVWRRDRTPTITVRADIYDPAIQAATVSGRLEAGLADIRKRLPAGYRLEVGGAIEESAKGGQSVAAGFPLMFLTMLTLLMIQLHSVQRMILVVLTAPLGLIGVTAFLLAFDKPFGFVAMLGTIALSGMIMRNSVILIDQIEQDIAAGLPPWEAIVGATVRRFRPIVLTALAAILAMVPLTRSVFFGPMAVAIMGGLTVATALTLLFLPAAYAAWFRVGRPAAGRVTGRQP